MDHEDIRLVILAKLADGRLSHDSIPRVWGGAGAGETCDACDEVVTKDQFIMEGVSTVPGKRGIQFHVQCFMFWDQVREVPGRATR